MGYEPTLIIRKLDLNKALPTIIEEQYCGGDEVTKVAEYLIDVSNFPTIKFDDLELVLCAPEFSSFNLAVRERLTDLNVDFRTDW